MGRTENHGGGRVCEKRGRDRDCFGGREARIYLGTYTALIYTAVYAAFQGGVPVLSPDDNRRIPRVLA